MKTAAFIQPDSNGCLLRVKVQPRASRNEIGEALGDELRLKVTAPPVDSAANEAVLRLLARTLGMGPSQIQLIRGRTSRHKLFRIHGASTEEVLNRLQRS